MKKHAQVLFYWFLLFCLIAAIANANKIVKAGQPEVKKIIKEVPVKHVYAEGITATPQPTKLDVINKYPHADILQRIWMLESTQGKATRGYHKGCEAKGLSNEFGYGVYQGVCFSTFEESVKTISEWFTTKLEKLSLAQSLCLYNIGKAINTCEYAQNFLNH